MAQWFDDRRVSYGLGPKSWQGWLLMLAMILVVIGACLTATWLSDLSRWIPLIVIVLTAAIAVILLSLKSEGGDR